MDFRLGREFDFSAGRGALRRARRARSPRDPLPAGTLLNINCPAERPDGVEVTRLGKRLYNDELKLVEEDDGGRRRYQIYGFEPSFEDEEGTDLAAVARGQVAITPVHFDLTDHGGLDDLRAWDLERAARALARPPAPASR